MIGSFPRKPSFRRFAPWLICAALSFVPHSGSVAASAEHGKAVFAKAGCWQCHGMVGQGGVTGPRLAPDPIPAEALTGFVRSSNRQMPPYSPQIISDSDLADIHAYLSSIPASPDYNKIPALQF